MKCSVGFEYTHVVVDWRAAKILYLLTKEKAKTERKREEEKKECTSKISEKIILIHIMSKQ